MKTYDKTIGDLTVHASEPFPRFVDIHYKQHGCSQIIRSMTLKEARDLSLMLAEVLELADEDED